MSGWREQAGAALRPFHSGSAALWQDRVMTRSRKVLWFALLALAAVSGLSGCKKGSVADDPQHDRQTEAQREQDCADPQWKAANLGLWYNICSGGGQH